MSHRSHRSLGQTLKDWGHRVGRHMPGRSQFGEYDDTTPEELRELVAAATGAQGTTTDQGDIALTEPLASDGVYERPTADLSRTQWRLREFLRDSDAEPQASLPINRTQESRLTWDDPLVLKAQLQSAGRTIESYRHNIPVNFNDVERFTDFCSSLYNRRTDIELTREAYIPSEQLLHDLINATTDDYPLTSALQDIRSYLYEDAQFSKDGDGGVLDPWQIDDLRECLESILPASPVQGKTQGEINAEKWGREFERSKSQE